MLRPDGRPSRRRRRAMLREACVNIALTMLAVALSAASLMVAVKVARECPGGPVIVEMAQKRLQAAEITLETVNLRDIIRGARAIACVRYICVRAMRTDSHRGGKGGLNDVSVEGHE
jgi:hypothetical protein